MSSRTEITHTRRPLRLQPPKPHHWRRPRRQTQEFRKFGGPIQLASNAMESLRNMDAELYSEIEARATWTGNRTNGIKDGIRDEWYAKFDLQSPAESRGMPFTCVVERPELQEIMMRRTNEHIRTSSGVEKYRTNADGSITATIAGGEEVHGDVLIGADGIWSNVRASMTDTPSRGEESGVSYSGDASTLREGTDEVASQHGGPTGLGSLGSAC